MAARHRAVITPALSFGRVGSDPAHAGAFQDAKGTVPGGGKTDTATLPGQGAGQGVPVLRCPGQRRTRGAGDQPEDGLCRQLPWALQDE